MKHLRLVALFCLAAGISTLPAVADPIAWTKWTAGTGSNGGLGTATGNIGAITVSYSGQADGLLIDYPSWTPGTTFSGGTVGNAPPAANNSVKIEGGLSGVETITFSTALVNPVFAIWSLGQGGLQAAFDFTSSEPFTIQAGGPSTEYGGQSITQVGNNANGVEGNGVIQFNGTFTHIDFTTPTYENYYAFTVGADTAVTPEPSTFSLIGLGLSALPFARRAIRRRRS